MLYRSSVSRGSQHKWVPFGLLGPIWVHRAHWAHWAHCGPIGTIGPFGPISLLGPIGLIGPIGPIGPIFGHICALLVHFAYPPHPDFTILPPAYNFQLSSDFYTKSQWTPPCTVLHIR